LSTATSAEPTPRERACGTVRARFTTAWVRPMRWAGVAAWAAVASPITAAGIPAPAITRPASTSGSSATSSSVAPAPNRAAPVSTMRRGPSRPTRNPPATEPARLPQASHEVHGLRRPRACGGLVLPQQKERGHGTEQQRHVDQGEGPPAGPAEQARAEERRQQHDGGPHALAERRRLAEVGLAGDDF